MPRALVISFDRLHAGYLGCYGNDWIETEHLDRLAAESVVFDGLFADDLSPAGLGRRWWWLAPAAGANSPTAAATASGARETPLPGLLRHLGIRTICCAEADLSTSARATPLWDELAQIEADDVDGAEEAELPVHQLAAAVAEAIESGEFGPNSLLWVRSRGVPEPWYPAAEFATLYFPEFELVDDSPVPERRSADAEDAFVDDAEGEADAAENNETGDQTSAPRCADEPVTTAARMQAAMADVAAHDEPAETDATPDPELEVRLARALYAAYVTSIDRAVGRILHALTRARLLDETLVIVTAASGQLLGEHAQPGHLPDHLPYELTHLPCIVRLPEHVHGGTRRHDFLQPGDLAEAIAAWFSSEPRQPAGSQDPQRNESSNRLIDAINGSEPGRELVLSHHPELGWSVRCREAVYCRSPHRTEGQLFLQPYDRHEFADEAAHYGDLADRLAAAIPPDAPTA